MRFKLAIINVLLVLIFLSCKKEDLTPQGANPGSGTPYIAQLSRILTNNQISAEFVYNDSDMVRQEKCKYDFTSNQFNANGQLIRTELYSNDDFLSTDLSVSSSALNSVALMTSETGKKSGIVTYEYNSNGQLTKATSTHPSLTCAEYSLFAYDANNRISKQTMYWENIATGYVDYIYDTKGNLASETLYSLSPAGAAGLISTVKYIYDAETNPFKQFKKMMIPGIYSNTNNIIKETLTIHVPSATDKVVVTENTYTYNTLGYPVSRNGSMTYVYK